ncbi:MAG: hypothetical protein WBP46_11205 [Thiolinea sp.]
MFVVYKNGKTFLETESYAHACRQARIDAYRNRESRYSIWDKEKRTKSGKEFLPLYRITLGSVYRTAYMPVGEGD